MGKKQCVAMAAAGAVMFAAGFLVRMAWDGYVEKQELLAAQAEAAEAEEKALAQQNSQAAPETTLEGYLDADVIQVRIEDNRVQWYDGRLWHEVASVEELRKKDRFYLAEEAFREFDEQLRQEKADGRQAEASGESGEADLGTLSVGVKETPRPIQRPKSTSAPQTPVEIPEPEAGPADSGGSGGGNPGGGGSSGGGSDGGGSSGGGSGGGDSGGGSSGGGDSSGGGSGGGNPGGGDSGGGAPVAPPPVEEPSNPGDSGSGSGDGENMEWSDDYL